MNPARVRVGHSPDPDDAFMFYAIASGLVDARSLAIEGVAEDIATLNDRATRGDLEATALSVAAYAGVSDRYALLPFGASLGEGYGPVVVARTACAPADLAGARVAIPGETTTAALVGRLALPPFVPVVLAFTEIIDAVGRGDVDAGILIHEGQLTYADAGLVRVLDLGAYWADAEDGLPLPLGAIALRRDLPGDIAERLAAVLRDAIEAGLAHRAEALEFAARYGRGIDAATNDRFVAMYVTDLTRDLGDRGRRAITRLLDRGAAAGLLAPVVGDPFAALS